MNTITAKDLYWELNKIYSSPHNDSSIEMAESELELNEAMGRGISPESIIAKMKQMIAYGTDEDRYKARLSMVIKNRFWDKTYVDMIEYRRLKVE